MPALKPAPIRSTRLPQHAADVNLNGRRPEAVSQASRVVLVSRVLKRHARSAPKGPANRTCRCKGRRYNLALKPLDPEGASRLASTADARRLPCAAGYRSGYRSTELIPRKILSKLDGIC